MDPEPADLADFVSAMKERFQQSTSEYINKLEASTCRPGEGVETIFGRFKEIAEVVEEDGVYPPTMLGIQFHSRLPSHIKLGMAQDDKDEGKRTVQMTREEIRFVAGDQEK